MYTLANREREVTWNELCDLEPRLIELEQRSRSVRVDWHVWNGCSEGYIGEFEHKGRPCPKCRGGMRNHLYRRVGDGRRDGGDPLLRTSEAWDIAVLVLYYKDRRRQVLGPKKSANAEPHVPGRRGTPR